MPSSTIHAEVAVEPDVRRLADAAASGGWMTRPPGDLRRRHLVSDHAAHTRALVGRRVEGE